MNIIVHSYLQMITVYVVFAAADLQWLFKLDPNLHLLAVFWPRDPDWSAKFWWNNHHREISHSTLGRVTRAKLKVQKKMKVYTYSNISRGAIERILTAGFLLCTLLSKKYRQTDISCRWSRKLSSQCFRWFNGPGLPEYTPRDQRLLVRYFLKDKQQKYIYRMKSGFVFSILLDSAVINRNELIIWCIFIPPIQCLR